MAKRKDIGGGNHKQGCLIPTLFFCLSILSFYQACNNPRLSNSNTRRTSSYMTQGGAKMKSEPHKVENSNPYNPKDQKRILDASKMLTKYKHQIENSLFIQQVDLEIKEGLYEGYDMEYFYFHEFRTDVVKELYSIFFSTYDYFTPEEQDILIETAKEYDFYTWNSKKKELAIYGNHLQLLADAFGDDSFLFHKYKEKYVETRSVSEAVNSLMPKTLRNRDFSFKRWEEIEKRKFNEKQKEALKKILFAAP